MASHLRSLVFLFLFVTGYCHAQGTVADYRRAQSIDTLFRNKVYNNAFLFYWLKEGNRFWYKNNGRGGKQFLLGDVATRQQQPAFDHDKLAASLAGKLKRKVQPGDLPFDRIDFINNNTAIDFQVDSAKCRCDLTTYACEIKEIVPPEKRDNRYWGNGFDESANKPELSPDSVWQAFIRNYNVYISKRKGKEEYQLSYDGNAGNFYSSYMEWSPDSRKLMAYKIKPGEKHLIYFVESSPKDQLQPKLGSRDYLKPGDELAHRVPQLFLIDEKKQVKITDELFPHQFSLNRMEWRKDSRALTFEYNERGHQRYRVIEINPATGGVRALIEEQSNTFIDYSGKRYRYDVNDGKEIIWASERDGWNHLYLYDGATGKVRNQITKGQWVVRNVINVDEKARQIIFTASGMDKDDDPYFIHYFKVNFDGSGFKRLTSGNASHTATFSPDFNYFIDQYSRVDMPPVTVLRQTADGKEIMTLQEADAKDLLSTGYKMPEPFVAKGRDGKTDIWGVIIRPVNFDPARKYPVIEYIYAGPHSSFVPKTFSTGFRGMHALAELGFIVVQMDGMGTSNRSKAFHDVCWKNLKDAGFPDRIAWMQAAAARYPYMDISRVGIYGTSAGGQSAGGAVLFHPEFYKVSVSSCGCHDNRMDKMWWNEQWMGYPIGPHYAECSNVVNAHKLQGNLMLIVGEVDDNVDPASTMQVADALIKANKDFELVVVPGMGHSSGGDFGERKRRDFFVKHLLGVDPPLWKEVYNQ